MGKVFNGLMNLMRLNEDDYEDDYEDDFYEDEEIEKPKKSFFHKETTEEDLDYDIQEERKFKTKPQKTNSKITPMRSIKRQANGMEVCVIKPTSVEDSREITETLLGNRTVVLNLEGLDVEIAQRIIDFTSGSCFAINGNLQKVSNYIFIISPPNVDISGDFQDILDGAFNVPSIQTEF